MHSEAFLSLVFRATVQASAKKGRSPEMKTRCRGFALTIIDTSREPREYMSERKSGRFWWLRLCLSTQFQAGLKSSGLTVGLVFLRAFLQISFGRLCDCATLVRAPVWLVPAYRCSWYLCGVDSGAFVR